MKDSAPEKWEYREHTKVKHILLEKYLSAWIPILGRYNPRICYFDGFAGRGEYVDRKTGQIIPGSPLIALRLADKLSKYFGELKCYFIEKDKDNFDNLEDLLRREEPNIKNWQKIEIEKRNDEFANVIEEIFENIREGYILVPSFFFVDPFGFSGIPFSVIKRILLNPKTEVFFTFMVRDIARFIQLTELEETFNSLFGTDKWRGILSSSQKPEMALIDLYREQLHKAVNVQYSWPFRVCTSEKVQTLYYLLHATNNYKGHSIMKQIMYRQSALGNFAYLGPQDIAARSQMKLFEIDSIENLKDYLLERFQGREISYDKIQEEVCVPWYSEPPYINTHYNQALKQLENGGKIHVDRIISKTPRGLSGPDKITFPQSNPIAMDFLSTLPQVAVKLKVHRKEYQKLDGRREILVDKVNDGSIIKRFDKTPPPLRATSIVCPHFIELKWAYGCPFDCAWCYLKGTFRFLPTRTKPVFKDYQKIELHTRRFLEEVTTPEILNTGEIADSLMGEGLSEPFSKFIIPMFEEQNRHKVLFLTKSDNIKHLLQINPHNQVIMSFSLNADEVAKRWERGAPSVDRRIEAGRKLSQAGYEVRIRIDPMVPIPDWKRYYTSLVDQIFTSFTPSRITLGSLRGLQSTINGSTDTSWVEYLKENSNWGKKIDFKTRHEIYAAIINQLKQNYNYSDIALCKETLAMWARLGMDYKQIKCNCIW
jgi:spore photoproduct lyase